MPGSSLWLVPPVEHPLHKIITDLTHAQLPAKFPDLTGPLFAPHMTLTSNISPATYGDEPQKWLDSLPLPRGEEVKVSLRAVKTEDVFYRRCYMKVDFEGVRDVAGIARARGVNGEESIGPTTEKWLLEWASSFGPHVSLIYGTVPIDEGKLDEITHCVKNHGVILDSSAEGSVEGMNGWSGGTVWLVPTDRPIEEWKPIATRRL